MEILISQAMEYLKELDYPKTRATIIEWGKSHGIGHQAYNKKLGRYSGPWVVDKDKLNKYLSDNVNGMKEKLEGLGK